MAGAPRTPSNPAPTQRRRGRSIKACENCRNLKTRCRFTAPSHVCDKCIELGTPCTMLPQAAAAVAAARKNRNGVSTRSTRTNASASNSSGDPSARRPEDPPTSSGAMTDSEATFDSELAPFDFRAVIDQGAFVPDPTPLPDMLNEPGMLLPDIPETFLNLNDEKSPSPSPKSPLSAFEAEALSSRSADRIMFRQSPMFMALNAVDPSVRAVLGSASKLMKPLNRRGNPRNVISLGVLDRTYVLELLHMFKLHLNHWILLPDVETAVLLDYLLHKCPLLVTVCTAVGLRLCSRDSWVRFYPALVDYMAKELSVTLANPPRNVEFLQAIMLLSIYGSSLSYQEHVFDMWYLSGIGIQNCMTSTALSEVLTHHHLRIWNHLVNINMHGAVLTARPSVLDSQCIKMCRKVIKEPFADRFDHCLLAEILAYENAHKFFINEISYEQYEAHVADWRKEWAMIINTPALQFSEPVQYLLGVLVHLTHLRRIQQPPTPPTSAATLVDFGMPFGTGSARDEDDPFTPQWLESLPTQELVECLSSFNSSVSGIITPISGRLFRHLSDMLHEVAFTAAVVSIEIQRILTKRVDVPDNAGQIISGALMFPRRLAELFHATSRGQDVQQTRCYGLVKLLQTVQ